MMDESQRLKHISKVESVAFINLIISLVGCVGLFVHQPSSVKFAVFSVIVLSSLIGSMIVLYLMVRFHAILLKTSSTPNDGESPLNKERHTVNTDLLRILFGNMVVCFTLIDRMGVLFTLIKS